MKRSRSSAIVASMIVLVSVGAASAQQLFSPSQDPVAGSRVFGTKGCTKCHAVNGLGAKVGPDLGRIERPHTFYDLAAALWNHAPKMADRMRQLHIARPELDAREAGDLVAFLFTLNYFDPPGNADVGRRLFSDKQCIRCHQVGGTGGVIGPNLDEVKEYDSPIYLATEMWKHASKMSETMKAQGIPRPTFKDSELVDVLAYINSASKGQHAGPLVVLPGRPDEGRRLFAEKRCIQCHSAAGQGGKVGPDLAERGVHKSLTQFAAAMWNKAPVMMDAMKSRGIEVPQVSPEEMADIVAYLYSVRYFAQGGDAKNGAKIATYKGCLGCHGLYGERGKTAVDLAKSRRTESPAAIMSALWNHSFVTTPSTDRARAGFAELTGGEMSDLMTFLQSLKGAK